MKEDSLSGRELRIKVLIDADVILEFFWNRGGLVENIESLLKAGGHDEWIQLYISEKCLKRIRIEDSHADEQTIDKTVHEIEKLFRHRILDYNEEIRELARQSTLKDFDSAEELACAVIMGFDAIVTLNPQNFNGASLPIWSVDELLVRLRLEQSLKAENSSTSVPQVKPSYELTKKLDADLVEQSPKAKTAAISTLPLEIPQGWHPNRYLKYLQVFDPQEIWSD